MCKFSSFFSMEEVKVSIGSTVYKHFVEYSTVKKTPIIDIYMGFICMPQIYVVSWYTTLDTVWPSPLINQSHIQHWPDVVLNTKNILKKKLSYECLFNFITFVN